MIPALALELLNAIVDQAQSDLSTLKKLREVSTLFQHADRYVFACLTFKVTDSVRLFQLWQEHRHVLSHARRIILQGVETEEAYPTVRLAALKASIRDTYQLEELCLKHLRLHSSPADRHTHWTVARIAMHDVISTTVFDTPPFLLSSTPHFASISFGPADLGSVRGMDIAAELHKASSDVSSPEYIVDFGYRGNLHDAYYPVVQGVRRLVCRGLSTYGLMWFARVCVANATTLRVLELQMAVSRHASREWGRLPVVQCLLLQSVTITILLDAHQQGLDAVQGKHLAQLLTRLPITIKQLVLEFSFADHEGARLAERIGRLSWWDLSAAIQAFNALDTTVIQTRTYYPLNWEAKDVKRVTRQCGRMLARGKRLEFASKADSPSAR